MSVASSPGAPSILVVDDSEVVLTVTKNVLESAGYRVMTHSGPSGCVALILQERPDLVLIDVNMPKLGGETIVKLFGKAQPNSETIVLLYSTLSSETLREKVLSSGAHGFIRKTESSYELVSQVNRWLRPRDGAGVRTASAERATSSGPTSGARPRATAADSAPERAQPVETRQAPRVSGTGRLLPVVLFVDGEIDSLSAFRREVQNEPYTTEFALSPAQAMRHLRSDSPPDVVVSALDASGWGIQFYAEAIAQNADWRRLFVFVLQRGATEHVAAFLGEFEGVVLERPIEGAQLRESIRRVLATGPTLQGRTQRA